MAGVIHTLIRAKNVKRNKADLRAVGGRSLGLADGSTLRMVRRLQRGFPYAALVRFQREIGLPLGKIADLVQIPRRTLMRRRAERRLRPEESERLLRLSRVFDHAADLFEGDKAAARRWLATPTPDLDDQTPLEFARTEIGAREVEDLIGRLEYGVFT